MSKSAERTMDPVFIPGLLLLVGLFLAMVYLHERISIFISNFYAKFQFGFAPYLPPRLEYPPLDTAQESLRLLVLRPGSWCRCIQCDLVSASFSDNPEYHVLSYASRNETASEPIWINGTVVKVKPSLRHALYWLRQSTHPQSLWVDELCIDQTNTAEKNNQASLRAFICRRAESVLLWLGARGAIFDTSQNPTAYFAALEQARQSSNRNYQLRFRRLECERENRLRAMRELDRRLARGEQSPEELKQRIDRLEKEDAELGRAIYDMASQPYVKTEKESFLQDIKPCLDRVAADPLWQQVWVLPEIMLASEIRIAYGEGRIPWDRFMNWLSYYDKTFPNTPSIKFILSLDQMRQKRYRNVAEFSLSKLLEFSKNSFSEVPHDRVYAFLNLAYDHLDKTISLDYRKPLFNVYQDTVRFQNSKSSRNTDERAVEMVRFSSLAHGALTEEPGWRRKWEMTEHVRANTHQHENLPFVGEEEYPFLLQERKQPRTEFGLKGLAMRIEYIGPPISALQGSSDAMYEWDATIHGRMSNDDDNFPEMMTRNENLKRTLARKARSRDESIGKLDLIDSASDPGSLRLFLGTGGAVGLVPGNAEKGDLIFQFWNHRDCAVLSANTAYPATGGGQRYKLVAKAIIAGLGDDWELEQDKKRFTNITQQSDTGKRAMNLYTSLDTLILLSS